MLHFRFLHDFPIKEGSLAYSSHSKGFHLKLVFEQRFDNHCVLFGDSVPMHQAGAGCQTHGGEGDVDANCQSLRPFPRPCRCGPPSNAR